MVMLESYFIIKIFLLVLEMLFVSLLVDIYVM